MRKILSAIALLMAATTAYGQATATNWTAPDCSGASHTLFSELDSNKIIVFVWVMPCSSCIAPSKTAYKVVQNFGASNPGLVRMYLSDDLGDDNCSALASWITANSIGAAASITTFGNAGNDIDEANFGGTGMPHVVVMAGSGHQVYFNKKSTAADDSVGITAAVSSAIAALGITPVCTGNDIVVTPSPTTGSVGITYPQGIRSVSITSISGQVVKRLAYATITKEVTISIAECAKGIYMVQVTGADGKINIQKVVKQ